MVVPMMRLHRWRNRRLILSTSAMIWGWVRREGLKGLSKGKGRVENIKKSMRKRGGSISSLESDLRSSNFVFVQGVDSVTGNARQSDDDEAQDGEKYKRNNDAGADISKENGESADDENQSSTTEFDPLAEAVVKLQSALDALDNEVQLVKEIRDEIQEPVDEEVHEASSSTIFTLGENTDISLHNLKKHVNTLKHDVDISKIKLEEAKAVLEAKETNVTKLEGEEIDAEIEELFKHKIEAEFQCLAISRVVEKLKNDVVDQFPLSDEVQTTLNVMRDTQSNVSMLKKQAERLETRIEDTVETEQVITLQKRIRQVTSCLFIQLILLILVFVSFVLDLSPHNAGIVPT